MANTLPDVTVPPSTWVDLYASTGIAIGVPLDIWNKGSNPVEIAISPTRPTNGVGVPIYPGPLSSYVNVDSGEEGAWAYSVLGSRLSVQKGT